MPTRRDILSTGAHACTAALALSFLPPQPGPAEPQRFMLIGLTGPENPSRSSLLLAWAAALAEAGHTVRLELAGDGTLLMDRQLADSLAAPGLPPLRSILQKVEDHGVPIFLCRPCAVARGIEDADLDGRNAQFTNAQAMAAAMAWASKVLVV
jgi:predicted peroxiredoxin